MCSDDDLRAIVHEHQQRWSPQCRRGPRSSRASSLDTASQSQFAVFSSVESLSQSPVLPASRSVEQPPPSDHAQPDVPQQSLTPSSTDIHLQRKVFGSATASVAMSM